jgi:tRNA dimethylallyltransferase
MSKTDQKTAVTIFGPTASGKTSLAIKVANAFNGAIINADSRQIYKEMPIITAMPSAEEFAGAPHLMFDFLKPGEPFSVGDYTSLATKEAETLFKQGKMPLFVGGTGFYLKVLMEGLSLIPEIPESLVNELTEKARISGVKALHKELAQVDKDTAERLEQEDTHRIIRALSVYQHTGNTLTSYQKAPPTPPMPNVSFIKVAILPERETLYKRIHDRFDVMLAEGIMEEAKRLHDKGYLFDNQALTSLGLKEIFGYIDGKVSFEGACEQTLQQMRRYAKRQTTWLHNQYKADILLESCDEVDEVIAFIQGKLRSCA